MARCPDCNKFATKDVDTEPEIVKDLEVDEDGEVTMNVRIFNNCADCSTELEEAELELTANIPEEDLTEHKGKKHILSPQDDEPEVARTDSGGGRYAKRLYGVESTVSINCSCGDSWNVDLKGEIAASHMESTV
jgi:hypothetical protein